ncbi:hypothetical protein SCG7086_CB_00070 [Chlamydiales bacterium SCGC AG-110-P3]|nr:hypothetical protein SCG7086_CB_00070 [Chlamydiales bacterium SCGC AG-110-P3]
MNLIELFLTSLPATATPSERIQRSLDRTWGVIQKAVLLGNSLNR